MIYLGVLHAAPMDEPPLDKLHQLKNDVCPVGEAAIAFDFKKCCSAKG